MPRHGKGNRRCGATMDTMTKTARSALMARIRGDNLGPETRVAAALPPGVLARASRNAKDLPGSPDLAWRSAKVAVFVHGCFWHCCPRHWRCPSSEKWKTKFASNARRDRRSARQLRASGWSVLVVWEHSTRGEALARSSARIARRVAEREKANKRKQRKTTCTH